MTNYLHYAIRRLLREPVLTLAATATLALCIGANTTVFSLVHSILLRPLPYPDSARICWVWEDIGRDRRDINTAADYYSLAETGKIFESVGAFGTSTANWSGPSGPGQSRPEQLNSAQVTTSFFRVMGTAPMLGRTLAREEEGKKAPKVVVISYSFWRNGLQSDPAAIGRKVILDRAPHIIIGVMPQGFDYPRNTEIWQPLLVDESTQRPRSVMRSLNMVSVVARLTPGVTREQMEAEMPRLSVALHAEYPPEFDARGFTKNMAIHARPLQEKLTGDLRQALLVLTGAVGLVLLIACVNLANLLLARAGARRPEIAVRLALGASRAAIVWQMLTESVVLALPGGLAGVAIAAASVRLLNVAKPMVLVRYPAITLDVTTLTFTFGLTLLTGIIFGMAPAVEAARIDIQDTLKSAALAHSDGPRTATLRRALVVAELSVSLVLLIGAGLLARSFVKLSQVELGFEPKNVLTMRVNLAGPAYSTGEAQEHFYRTVLERVRALPMVTAASVSTDLPLTGEAGFGSVQFQIGGQPSKPIGERPVTGTTYIDPEFFRAMGIPLRRGRFFDVHDTPDSPRMVLINETFARHYFPDQDPVGRTILVRSGVRAEDQDALIIAGVAANTRGNSLGIPPSPVLYQCVCQSANSFLNRMRIIVRTPGAPYAAARAVSDEVYAVDREQPVFEIKSMEDRVAESLAPERFQLLLTGTFTFLALVLAAAGVYGVMSYLVSRRTREIAIRMAMGARPADVLRLVFRESILLAPVAIALGLGGAWALVRYIKSMLYGIAALDTPTFLITPLVLAMIVVAASLGPARRASRVDPMTALREQ
jgi:putative ABC transport system permease protein